MRERPSGSPRPERPGMPTLERAGMGGVTTLSGFSGNGFRIGESVFQNGLLLWPDAADHWMPPALDALQPGDFAALDNADPPLDLLLIGTGAQLRRPDRKSTPELQSLMRISYAVFC